MKKPIVLIAPLFFCTLNLYAQSNCFTHAYLNICPVVPFANQTNVGMGDDAPSSFNIAGEDVAYEIAALNGADKIFVSISNASAPIKLTVEESTCTSGVYYSMLLPAGNSDVSFNVNSVAKYFLWVDAATAVTYNLAVGADTATVFINVPNTQGNLQFDNGGCAVPPFKASKPFFQVSYNNVYQTHPMTLAPLFTPGILCVSTYFKNTTGIEGIQKFVFHFNPLGYSGISIPVSIPGMYNSGSWHSVNSGNNWTLTFIDSAGSGKGDFTGVPDTCLKYNFCFNLTPLSNDTLLTNVDVAIYSDGFGLPYSNIVHYGCCPNPDIFCLGSPGGGGGGGGGGHAFGFGFADPPGPLPINLVAFNAKVENDKIRLSWQTASQTNNDYFTIEKSSGSDDWMIVSRINGAGNSTSLLSYYATDENPLQGTSYYRLKQTDFDGNYSYSAVKEVTIGKPNDIKIYPNPASGFFIIQYNSPNIIHVSIYNILGIKIQVPVNIQSGRMRFNTSQLPQDLYYVVIEENQNIILKEKIIIQN